LGSAGERDPNEVATRRLYVDCFALVSHKRPVVFNAIDTLGRRHDGIAAKVFSVEVLVSLCEI